MADGIVWNLAAKALELLGKEAVRKAASWWGARDDLNKLENTISMIQARVRDAERRQEDASSDAIKEWLRRLKLVLYQADDLFDEVLTLDLQKQQMENSLLAKVGILFSKSGPLCYNRRLAKEIKSIRTELDVIRSDMAELNLSVLRAQDLPMAHFMGNRETSSFVIQEDVTGREKDLNNIIEMLLDPKKHAEQMSVISIVGFGGLGKTTLAQLVFSDARVQQHFDLKKWAYVPEINHRLVVMGKIYRSLTDTNYDNLSLEQIQQGIRESIENKKYLLVLDDIWDEGDDIKELLNLLKGGNPGSKVILTTRSNVVAKHFGRNQAAYKLGTLTDDQSWELFKKLAFGPGDEDNNPALSKIGKQIVEMCKNVPLGIKIIGGSLCSKHTTEEWLQVKKDLSKAQLANNNEITAVLKLSYDYLSPNSKLCFAYCSLFPKGYEFEKDELVRLWMAQGYVEPDEGGQYFLDLVARNLFQVSKIGYSRHVKICKMHDLLHDLAQVVAGDESIMLGNERPNQIHNRLLHLNLNGLKSPPSLKKVYRLRSLLKLKSNVIDDKFFSEFLSLRVLTMHHYFYYKKLPSSIGRLIHLRYLEIESDVIEYLPDSITKLVNIQTLSLKSCEELKELPRDFARLVNLRHLFLPCEKLTDLPPGFGKLTSLQEFHWLILREGNGIDSLRIWFYKWRNDAIEEVKRANLKDNYQLTSLVLDLDIKGEESTIVGEMNEMLRCLQLPPNLTTLEIWNYKGDEMPVSWQGLSSLRQLTLGVIPKMKTLPPGIACITTLQQLRVHHMENLIEFPQEMRNLSLLRLLSIVGCPKVTSLPPSILGLPMLHELRIWEMENLTELAADEIIGIGNGNGNFPPLRVLDIERCPKIKSLSPLNQGLASLEDLTIGGCPDVAKKNMPGGEEWHLIQHIPSLRIHDGSMEYKRRDGEEVKRSCGVN